MSFLSYLFDPVPQSPDYGDPQILPFLIVSVVLLVASFFLSGWRKRNTNPVTKKLSRSWATAAFVYGFVGLVLVVSRVESIQYVAMRFWWILWAGFLILFTTVQYRLFQSRNYEILPKQSVHDPRDRYLPKKKR